ncbi:MAG TPA: hypothetical protein VF148_15080 [Acidimicrobiia bacterium]
MRRLLTMTVAAVTLVGVMSGTALAGGAGRHLEGYHQTGDVVESISEAEPLTVERTDPEPTPVARPVPFDGLWLTIVGLVGLLLVIRTAFAESRWPRHPASDQISRNGSGLGDVLTDE